MASERLAASLGGLARWVSLKRGINPPEPASESIITTVPDHTTNSVTDQALKLEAKLQKIREGIPVPNQTSLDEDPPPPSEETQSDITKSVTSMFITSKIMLLKAYLLMQMLNKCRASKENNKHIYYQTIYQQPRIDGIKMGGDSLSNVDDEDVFHDAIEPENEAPNTVVQSRSLIEKILKVMSNANDIKTIM